MGVLLYRSLLSLRCWAPEGRLRFFFFSEPALSCKEAAPSCEEAALSSDKPAALLRGVIWVVAACGRIR